jgi:hypothetical protein
MSHKTERTKIRCWYWLLALIVGCVTLTIGTYINARYNAFSVQVTADDPAPTPPMFPKTEKDAEQGGGNI